MENLLTEDSTSGPTASSSISDDVVAETLRRVKQTAAALKTQQARQARTEKKTSTGRSVFACDYADCGKTFLSFHSLKAHTMSHTGQRPYVCEWEDCGRGFTSFYSLSAHCRTHTGQRPYACSVVGCQKAFKSSSDLRRHSRVHTGDKPYACTYRGCFKSFSTSDIRKVHMRSHTGERPFQCDFDGCHRTFTTQTNLANHRRTHTGEKPFQCKEPGCGKSFGEHSTLHKHQTVHRSRNRFPCEMCRRTFRSASTCAAHRRRDHGYLGDDAQDANGEEAGEDDDAAQSVIQPSDDIQLGSAQRIQLLLTDLDVGTLRIEGETAQVLVLPADGDQIQGENGSYNLHLLDCAGALVVRGDGSPDLVVVSPTDAEEVETTETIGEHDGQADP